LLKEEEDRRLLLFSVSSDGDLRGWAFDPEKVSFTFFYPPGHALQYVLSLLYVMITNQKGEEKVIS